jgi:transposase
MVVTNTSIRGKEAPRMRHSSQGRFRQQVQFLRRQFLQDGDLPFTDLKQVARLGGRNPSWFKLSATAAIDFPVARSSAIRSLERQQLSQLLASGKAAAQKLTHARALLKADAGPEGPAWTDQRIAQALEVSVATVERLRQRFVEQGLDAALVRKKQDHPSRPPLLDGAAKARLIALACSAPPEGRTAWTLRLLADKLVELEIVESVSYETVRQVLKKTHSSRT